MPVSDCNSVGARLLLGLALVVVTYGMLSPQPVADLPLPQGDKLAHLLSFLVLALLADLGWAASGFGPWKYLPLLGYGIAMECVQYYLPGRDFELLDIVADAAGLALYSLILSPVLRKVGIR
jgi:VanZ family protein